jgi:RNA polymerase sigma factor (sigma-70 family)
MASQEASGERWYRTLQSGDFERAWDLFIADYRRLIFATIRHFTRDEDEIMEVFADVCGALCENQLARLRSYWDRTTHSARFSSWLVLIVRHRVIDWLRHRTFRKRPELVDALTPLQQRIFEEVFVNRRSHVEAFEILAASTAPALSFSAFLRELTATYRGVDSKRRTRLARELAGAAPLGEVEAVSDEEDPAVLLDSRLWLANALSVLEPNDRLAVMMFVVHEMPAAAVAQALGWPNAKAVYNRVYRALTALRAGLERYGITRADV